MQEYGDFPCARPDCPPEDLQVLRLGAHLIVGVGLLDGGTDPDQEGLERAAQLADELPDPVLAKAIRAGDTVLLACARNHGLDSPVCPRQCNSLRSAQERSE